MDLIFLPKVLAPSPQTPSSCESAVFPLFRVGGAEEKTTEPKPRWNPKPEQIRILESIFNSGMVNPPRDEICRIRDQLQVYGQVGDANVFYWFQNRKSRSKHKRRHLESAAAVPSSAPVPPPPSATTSASSSSDRSSSGSNKLVLPALFDLTESLAPQLLNPELGLGASAFLSGISSTCPTPSGEFVGGGIGVVIPSLWSGLIMQGFSRKNGVGEEFGMLAVLGSVADAAVLPPFAIASNYMVSAMAATTTFNEMEGSVIRRVGAKPAAAASNLYLHVFKLGSVNCSYSASVLLF